MPGPAARRPSRSGRAARPSGSRSGCRSSRPPRGSTPIRFVLRRLVGGARRPAPGPRPGGRAGPARRDPRPRLRPPRRPAGASRFEQRFPEPTADAEAIERLLVRPPREGAAAGGRRAAGAGARAGGGRGRQQLPLFVPQAARDARLAWQLARLAIAFGTDRVRRVELTDPEAPLAESRWRWVPVAGAAVTGEETREDARPRDDPAAARAPAIDAELDEAGRLVAFRWNGRREPVEVCNRWRVEESWWREPIARDYFKVVGRSWLALVYLDRSRRHVASGTAVRLTGCRRRRSARTSRAEPEQRAMTDDIRTRNTPDDEGKRPEVSRSSRLHRWIPDPVTGPGRSASSIDADSRGRCATDRIAARRAGRDESTTPVVSPAQALAAPVHPVSAVPSDRGRAVDRRPSPAGT